MIGANYRQEPSQASEPDDVAYLIPINLADDAGDEFRMAIVLQEFKTGEYLIQLIGAPDLLIPGAIQSIEADRHGD